MKSERSKPPKGYRLLVKGEIICRAHIRYSFDYGAGDTPLKWGKPDGYDMQFMGQRVGEYNDYPWARRIAKRKKGAK